ncbi:MAG: dynamin family protein [Roseobacter sp.]
MTHDLAPQAPAFWIEPEGPRRPRIALMGEFSAGKSTLANLMIGTSPLPVQVVATQLPPVWIRYGNQPPVIVDLQGNETPCDFELLQDIDPQEVAFIRFYCEQEVLTKCDIIDMPGISDPNMSSAVWERIMPFADGVLWCSPSTQAWRQSEAAVWDSMEERVRQNSLLVLTRGDMLLTDMDKSKVMRRVKSEAGGLFAEVLMISLSLARDAGDDEEMWTRSGADEFVARFLELVDTLATQIDGDTAEVASHSVDKMASRLEITLDPAPEPKADAIVPRRPALRVSEPQDSRERSPDMPDPLSFMPKFS